MDPKSIRNALKAVRYSRRSYLHPSQGLGEACGFQGGSPPQQGPRPRLRSGDTRMNVNEKILLDALQGVIEDARSLEITFSDGRSAYVTLQGDTFTLFNDNDKPQARFQLVSVPLPSMEGDPS
jgi:hypothetical protein